MIEKVYDGKGIGKLLLISGVHGNEYTPIEALFQLEKDSEYLNNLLEIYEKITFLHAVNEHGIKNNIREYNGNTDLNRIFGNDVLREKLISQIELADYIIDVHASNNCTEFVLINNDNFVKDYVDFCIKNDIKYAVWEGSRNTIKSHSTHNNKIAFTVECDGIGTVNHKSLLRVMKVIKKLSLTKMKKINNNPTFDEKYILQTVTSEHDGFLVWTTKNNFFIRGCDGEILQMTEINEDMSTIILRNNSGYIKKNDYLYQYQINLSA